MKDIFSNIWFGICLVIPLLIGFASAFFFLWSIPITLSADTSKTPNMTFVVISTILMILGNLYAIFLLLREESEKIDGSFWGCSVAFFFILALSLGTIFNIIIIRPQIPDNYAIASLFLMIIAITGGIGIFRALMNLLNYFFDLF